MPDRPPTERGTNTDYGLEVVRALAMIAFAIVLGLIIYMLVIHRLDNIDKRLRAVEQHACSDVCVLDEGI